MANRTAQLAEMLAEDGKPEIAAALIEGLSSVVNAERGKETYGELCQFYFILRRNGADHGTALTELRMLLTVLRRRIIERTSEPRLIRASETRSPVQANLPEARLSTAIRMRSALERAPSFAFNR